MVIMALDHVRDYFHFDSFFYDPTDLGQTNPALFFTRFITHFCAPVFVFLAGTSAFFVGRRLSKKALSIWLLKRGFWLLLAEVTILKFGWTFSLDYSTVVLQVIWALGIGMICLAGFIHLPKYAVIAICLLGVAGHNLLDGYMPAGQITGGIWKVLHISDFLAAGQLPFFIAYPLIPWIFVMPLGYYFGLWYRSGVEPGIRIRRLTRLGLVLTGLFFVLRALNIYGDPTPFAMQDSATYSLLSFFNLTKYPPSLLYLLVTLGPSILFLAAAERFEAKWTGPLVVIGRVPMFFYIIHIYAIHILAVFAVVLSGHNASDMVISFWVSNEPQLQGYGFGLWMVYLVWMVLVLALYPLCYQYDAYKTRNRQFWWLSYL